VSFIFGDPQSYVDLVHDAGGLVMHTVGSAELLVESGHRPDSIKAERFGPTGG
jgi:NAD(P)H-dependent flavin oxidoreductase YrpB (nitropropane dioxygenase family)